MPRLTCRWPRRGLYLLTPDRDDTQRLCADVDAALGAGAVLLQYRNKSAPDALQREQFRALQPICVRHDVPLIVNDDVELALEFGADGVHVGEHDAGVAAARASLGPGAIVGASCYDDLDRARAAAQAGASYLAFGAFFPSATKPNARRASLPLLHDAASFGLPRVAIGGITPDNAGPLLAAGADFLAVVSDVFDAPDIAAAVRRYAPLFQDRP